MKKLLSAIAAVFLLSAVAPYVAAAEEPEGEDLELKTGKRLDTWLHIALPVYVGFSSVTDAASAVPWEEHDDIDLSNSPFYSNFCFGMEIAGLRFTSRSGKVEGDIGIRFNLNNVSGTSGSRVNLHTAYFGLPARVAYKIGRWGKVYAGLSADVLVSGTAGFSGVSGRSNEKELFNPFRATVEGGISWHGIGLWAGYGITPLFRPGTGTPHTLSYGIVIGL